MKNIVILSLFQGVVALVCGILMSKMSFVGRMGINLMHREYLIFKVWWKTALVIFLIQAILILILAAVKGFSGLKVARSTAVLFLILGIAGAYFTYIDFTTTSHKYMRAKFHAGGYLFWTGWIITCIYFAFSRKKQIVLEELSSNPENLEAEER